MTAIYFLIPILGVLIDQLTKHWAAVELKKVETIPLIQNVFHLTYCENTGAAFSMLRDNRAVLLIISFVLLAGILYALLKKWMKYPMGQIALCLILAGALGNIIDRVFQGYVVDFFDFCLIHFPIFNVADILLNVGVFLMVVYLLFVEPRRLKKEKKDENDHSDGASR